MIPYCTGTALLHRDKEMTQIWMSEIITTTLSNCIRYRAAAISDTVHRGLLKKMPICL